MRRFVTYVAEGDEVGCGQRIGAIRFSQLDLILPAPGSRSGCKLGIVLKAGESIVALIGPCGQERREAGVVVPGELGIERPACRPRTPS